MDNETIFSKVEAELESQCLTVDHADRSRPWGGFFVIKEDLAQPFANHYFDGLDVEKLKIFGKLSPKILVVAPQKRLSWQYHSRRAEIWRVVSGTVGVVKSDSDAENEVVSYVPGQIITLNQGERHRLVGLNEWAYWQKSGSTPILNILRTRTIL